MRRRADANLVLITSRHMNLQAGPHRSRESGGARRRDPCNGLRPRELIDKKTPGGTQNDNIFSGGDFTFIAETDGTIRPSGNRIEVNVAGDTMFRILRPEAVIAMIPIEVQEGVTSRPRETIIDIVTVQIHGDGCPEGRGSPVQGANGLGYRP
jgi:hypothetical protein